MFAKLNRRLLLYIGGIFIVGCTFNEVKAPLSSLPVQVPEVIKEELPSIDYDTLRWQEIIEEEHGIFLDLKYAGKDNFVKEAMYDCARAFVHPKVMEALAEVNKDLKKDSLALKIFDAYRPRPVQQKLWDKVPDKRYVAPPSRGSMHNRGVAVDLTLTDLAGNDLDMGTPYDFFGKEAWPEYMDLPKEVLRNRRVLHTVMRKYGFQGIRTEWWHFSLSGTGAELSDWLWECK